jgi:hypothetical protein
MTRQVEGVSVKLADEQHNRERTDSTKAISQKSNLYIDSQGGRGGGTPPCRIAVRPHVWSIYMTLKAVFFYTNCHHIWSLI